MTAKQVGKNLAYKICYQKIILVHLVGFQEKHEGKSVVGFQRSRPLLVTHPQERTRIVLTCVNHGGLCGPHRDDHEGPLIFTEANTTEPRFQWNVPLVVSRANAVLIRRRPLARKLHSPHLP